MIFAYYNQAANIPHYLYTHYHERNFSDWALFCAHFEPYLSTVDNVRAESILVPTKNDINSNPGGLQIGVYIMHSTNAFQPVPQLVLLIEGAPMLVILSAIVDS